MSISTTARSSSRASASRASKAAKNGKQGQTAKHQSDPSARSGGAEPLICVPSNGKAGWFTTFAQKTAHLAGRPGTFMLASATIVVWAVTGPLFNYSDTWQLVINTSTTIVTFLMVFLIQHTQNRDTLALQVKLDELIIAVQGANNHLAGAEDLSDEDLEALHETYRKRATEALETLETRRRALTR
jgi:low affinity Fe/Cu permease